MAIRIARRYAQALLDAIRSEADLERAERDLAAIESVLRALPSLGRVLAHPGVKPERRRKLLDEALSGIDGLPQIRRMMALLVEARALPALAEIAQVFRQLKDRKTGMTSIEVTTFTPIPDGDRAAWESALAKTAGTRVRVDYRTDSSLIGGAVARVGSVMYDGSVRGSLERIRQSLLGE